MSLPLHERHELVRDLAKAYGLRVLVETGSGDGDLAAEVAQDFARVFTIEVSASKYYGVWGRLLAYPNVLAIHGDSATALPHLLNHLTEPAVFWLDAHFDGGDTRGKDGDTPIEKELFAIFAARRSKPNVVLVDDARLFGSDPAYPDMEWIESRLPRWSQAFGWPEYGISVADDIIRICPVPSDHDPRSSPDARSGNN